MDALVDIAHKFNIDIDGQEKLLQKAERKFEHKVLEIVARKISIKQVQLSSLVHTLEMTLSNVTKLFQKLCYIPSFRQEI